MECDDDDFPPPHSSPLPMSRYKSLSREHTAESISLSVEMTEKMLESQASKAANTVKNQSHSLKRSILNKFIPLTFSLLLVVSLCTIAALYVSSAFILDETHKMLTDQYSRYGGFIAKGESAAITSVLSWTGLEVETGMACDFYRTNYSIATANISYLAFPELLARPLISNEDRFPGRNVSLTHSSYIFPNMSFNELMHGLSEAQLRDRDRMTLIDPIAKAIYDIKKETQQSFVSLEEDGMSVVYPGQGMAKNGSAVDPRSRPWYIQGKKRQNITIVTEPYIDYFTGEPVISLARAVHDVETGVFVGVGGVDFLVYSLQQYVYPAYNLQRELVMFVSSGKVLLDSDWFVNATSHENFLSRENIVYTPSSYYTIENPSISDEEWAKIQATAPGQNADLDIASSYHCYFYRFEEPLEDLVFLACAEKAVLLEEANDLELLVGHHWQRGLIVAIFISCMLIALTLSVFYYTVSSLAREVDRSYQKINDLFHLLRVQAEESCHTNIEPTERLSMNIDGGGNGKSESKKLLSFTGKDEEEEQKKHRRPGAGVRAISHLFSPSDSFNENPFWNKKHPFLHHHEVSERFLTRPPNTPPPSGRYLERSETEAHMHKIINRSASGHSSPLQAGKGSDDNGSDNDESDDDEYYCGDELCESGESDGGDDSSVSSDDQVDDFVEDPDDNNDDDKFKDKSDDNASNDKSSDEINDDKNDEDYIDEIDDNESKDKSDGRINVISVDKIKSACDYTKSNEMSV